MIAQKQAEKFGDWLFRHRGRFPLLLLPIALLALGNSEYLEHHYGKTLQTGWEIFCIMISMAGFTLRCLTVAWIPEGTSGRNTKAQLAESLNTEGMYSIVRHPLYFGNLLITLGFCLFTQVWWFVVIFLLGFFIFYEHILFREEAFLSEKFKGAYGTWASRTPAILPNLKLWKHSSRRFSWKMILKREYATLYGIITAFILIKIAAQLLSEHHFELRASWLILFGCGTFLFALFTHLKKNTRYFHIKPEEPLKSISKTA